MNDTKKHIKNTERKYDQDLVDKVFKVYRILNLEQKSWFKSKFDKKFGARRWERLLNKDGVIQGKEMEFVLKYLFNSEYNLEEIKMANSVRIETEHDFLNENTSKNIFLITANGLVL